MEHLEIAFKGVKKSDIKQGKLWYDKANRFASHLSNEYKVDFNKVCAVISALSPACNWKQNKLNSKTLINCYASELDYSDFKFSTYGQNVTKAWNILMAKDKEPIDFFSLKTGAKTYNFYLNILNPLDENFVTIDRHAISIYRGNKIQGAKIISLKEYQIISEAYKTFASKVNLKPCELQAILWSNHVNNILRN